MACISEVSKACLMGSLQYVAATVDAHHYLLEVKDGQNASCVL